MAQAVMPIADIQDVLDGEQTNIGTALCGRVASSGQPS
jgi:hypothetical protein